MEIRVETGSVTTFESDVLLVPVTKGDAPLGNAARVDGALGGHLADAMRRGEFKAGRGQTIAFPAADGLRCKRVVFVGVGAAAELNPEAWRRAAGQAARAANRGKFQSAAFAPLDDAGFGAVTPEDAAEAIATGACTGLYRFIEYKTEEDSREPSTLTVLTLLCADGMNHVAMDTAAHAGRALADGMALAMDLANHPSAAVTPRRLADEAAHLAHEHGMTLEVFDEEQMQAMGMGGMIGVGQGSAEPPRFIVLEHKGAEGAPVVLVGKSITFDTGGISIKPSAGMEEMKGDMSGGAAVLGVMRTVGTLNLPLRVIGILTAAENMPSGTAQNPGDILRMHNGLTVEVINTDAEGRLVLADGLSYAQKYAPRLLVDIATLTGACVVALGHHAIGLMGTAEEAKADFKAIGEKVGERVWELPLWKEYHDDIKSDVADIKNTGGRPGGTITAGCFLSRFAGDAPWVHLDIAATAWDAKATDYLPAKGASGVGVRLLTGMLRKLAAA
ncbi:MAG: leucyl aminopeptidase [Nitrospirae bacterium]|nr:leucyl aminopeptidase [Nitrospirota bacterium]